MINNRIIGYAYMVGDIIHEGHLLYLRNCKALCDKLIVGVLTDEAVLEKKPKAILTFTQRLKIVKSIKYVDVVVPQKTYLPNRNCELLKPDILFENIGREEQGFNENRAIIVFPYYPGISSTEIKKRIINARDKNM